MSAVLSRAFLSFQRAPKFTRNSRPIMMRRAPNPYLSFLPMLMTVPQSPLVLTHPLRRLRVVPDLLRLGGLFLRFFELPTLHGVHSGIYQQRRTADHLRALHVPVLADHQLQLDRPTDVHAACKLGV